MKTTKSVHETKIDWATHTCNIITGCLGPAGDGNHCTTPDGKEYCYAKPFANRIYRKPLGEGHEFEPHFWEERLEGIALAPEGARIFMNSMGDAFGDWVPTIWITRMLEVCSHVPECAFYFLTKNPKRYFEDGIETYFRNNKNFWAGFTAETGALYEERFSYYNAFSFNIQSFVSIEPIFDGKHNLRSVGGTYPGWVIVGAQTNPNHYPNTDWIENLCKQSATLGIPFFMKNSLAPLYKGENNLIQEVPDGK